MKKFLTIILACMLSASLVMPSFAETLETYDQELVYDTVEEETEYIEPFAEIEEEIVELVEEYETSMEEAEPEYVMETESFETEAFEEEEVETEVEEIEIPETETEEPVIEETEALEDVAETPVFEEETETNETLLLDEFETESFDSEIYSDYVLNPLYAGMISAEDLVPQTLFFSPDDDVQNRVLLNSENDVFLYKEPAVAFIRSQLKARTTVFSFMYFSRERYEDFSWSATCKELVGMAMAETGVSNEGDYLRWQYGGYNRSARVVELDPATNGGYGCYATYILTFTYYTTAAQEAELSARLASLYSELDLAHKNQYQKIRTIYDYICQNVVYDRVNTQSYPYYNLKHTAYAALMHGMAVCQGYALLFYRMALDNGLNARLIAGYGGYTNHGWNIVELDGVYYYVDPTWDAGMGPNYVYFMTGSNYFLQTHTVSTEMTPAFNYNISATNFNYGVLDDNITSITLPETYYAPINSTFTLSPVVTPSNFNVRLSWSSSDSSVATVDHLGNVAVLSYGRAIITVSSPLGTTGTCEVVARYTDMTDSTSSFYVPIYWAADNGIADGRPDGSFGAASNCTRGEFAVMLYRFAGRPETTGEMTFPDCSGYSPDSDEYQAILWASSNGIVQGYSNGNFGPTDSVTRKQIMIMLYRYVGKPAVSGTLKFTDCDYGKNSDSYKAILWGVQNGITNGTSSTTFGPDDSCLRRHTAFFLYKMR